MPGKPANWGAIFDWDGVVIDSRVHHEESWERLAAECGLPLPKDHFIKGFGRKNEYIIPEMLQWTQDPGEIHRLSLRKEALYRDVVSERGLSALPGVREWLAMLHDAGVPCAIGSSTHLANIQLSLRLLQLEGVFDAVVTSEDVTKGKPDPAVFLKAAERLHRPAARCVVFEDAHVGIAAANAAGMRVVGVATTHPKSELHNTDLAVERLDELDPKLIESWFPPA